MIPSPTQSNILAALRSFLLAVLPAGTDVIAGQPNRVPEPVGNKFVVMSPPRFKRLRTNIDSGEDVKFTGSIAAEVMTVTDVDFGTIEVGATVFGVGVAAGTIITELGTGTGGDGTYIVDPPQTVVSETLSSGAYSAEQGAEVTIQLDFHSDTGSSGDMAQVVSTLFRDPFAVAQFAGQDPNYNVAPLYADDPRQMPFFNDQQQTEWRWILECCLQANQTVSVPQQFSDSVEVDLVDVDATLPPA